MADEALCQLDVPSNKNSTAFTKPVDPLSASREAWHAMRSRLLKTIVPVDVDVGTDVGGEPGFALADACGLVLLGGGEPVGEGDEKALRAGDRAPRCVPLPRADRRSVG